VKGVLWDGSVKVVDVLRPYIRQGYILGKTVLAGITHIERAVSLGMVPIEVGRILGSLGIVRVIDVGRDLDSNLIGKYFLLLPRYDSIGGVDFDGILTEYAVLPHNVLIPISEYYIQNPEVLVYAELSYIQDLIRYVKGKEVLILGCGPTSYVITKSISKLCNAYIVCYHSHKFLQKIAEVGVYVANYDNISKEYYDVVLVLTLSSYLISRASKHVKDRGLILIPPTIPKPLTNLLCLNLITSNVRLKILNYGDLNTSVNILKNDLGNLKNLISIVDDYDKALNSMFHFWRVIVASKLLKT
jgi:NADPH:quinone reductase-like Zn-dependent oxidoreductase